MYVTRPQQHVKGCQLIHAPLLAVATTQHLLHQFRAHDLCRSLPLSRVPAIMVRLATLADPSQLPFPSQRQIGTLTAAFARSMNQVRQSGEPRCMDGRVPDSDGTAYMQMRITTVMISLFEAFRKPSGMSVKADEPTNQFIGYKAPDRNTQKKKKTQGTPSPPPPLPPFLPTTLRCLLPSIISILRWNKIIISTGPAIHNPAVFVATPVPPACIQPHTGKVFTFSGKLSNWQHPNPLGNYLDAHTLRTFRFVLGL
jgi:hypothetical protein